MSEPFFTILLPVVRPPHLLAYAIRSVQAQTVANFELFVICDGAPEATVDYARSVAAVDDRIRVLAFKKGQRHGEAYRHGVLVQASAPYVAQIADDDIWFPDHLSELALLLREVDFGNLLMTRIGLDGEIALHVGDLGFDLTRKRMLETNWNFFGPTVAGYRLSAYRRLPVGWSPAPRDIPTDLFMWRKFLRQPGLTFGTRFSIQALHLATSLRPEMTIEEREVELGRLADRLQDPAERVRFITEALGSSLRRHYRCDEKARRKLGSLQSAQ